MQQTKNTAVRHCIIAGQPYFLLIVVFVSVIRAADDVIDKLLDRICVPVSICFMQIRRNIPAGRHGLFVNFRKRRSVLEKKAVQGTVLNATKTTLDDFGFHCLLDCQRKP